MNIIHLMGRLTKDPEIRVSQGERQTQIARFSLAVDRRFDRDKVDFFNCTAFGKSAEFAEKYLRKGTKLVISGRMQCDNYTDKDGNKRTAWGVLVDEMEFAESKAASTGTQGGAQTQGTADGFMQIPEDEDEDLPFNFG